MAIRILISGRGCLGSNTSTDLVEAEVERVLDDERHDGRRRGNEVRELRREGRQQFGAVRLFICRPAARGLDFQQVGVRAAPPGMCREKRALTRRENRASSKQGVARPELTNSLSIYFHRTLVSSRLRPP